MHTHGNNYCDRDLNGDPTIIELSFGRFPSKKGILKFLSNKLDMPNNKYKDEVVLKFEI